ncbi:hypothetical protein C039_00493 [Brucella suis 63/261]|nr:hypothetical protein C039_00493 [Brucella suis 63/261]
MKPTVHDIARTAGVSLATVDRVLNDRPAVRAKTRDRVMAAMNMLGYVRDVGAANLARGRLYQFDFILPDNENTFMLSLRSELYAASERALAERVRINLPSIPIRYARAARGLLKRASMQLRSFPISANLRASIMSAWITGLRAARWHGFWVFLPMERRARLPSLLVR